jgi:hypothetical protein
MKSSKRFRSRVFFPSLLAVTAPTLAAELPPSAQAPETAGAPATAPAFIDPAALKLIEQLGDPDPAVREEASKSLAGLGRDALPALKDAVGTDDPEVRARVRSLIRKAERRLPPAAPPKSGFASRHRMSVSVRNGERTVDVDDNGHRIKIRQDPAGIEMEVTGIEDGREATETYKAKDAETLKQNNPEAFELYEKYNARADGGPVIGIGRAGGPDIRVAREQVMERHAQALERIVEDLERNAPGRPAEHQAQLKEHVARLRQQQMDMQEKLMQDMAEQRKKALQEMRVPEREETPKAKEQEEKK